MDIFRIVSNHEKLYKKVILKHDDLIKSEKNVIKDYLFIDKKLIIK